MCPMWATYEAKPPELPRMMPHEYTLQYAIAHQDEFSAEARAQAESDRHWLAAHTAHGVGIYPRHVQRSAPRSTLPGGGRGMPPMVRWVSRPISSSSTLALRQQRLRPLQIRADLRVVVEYISLGEDLKRGTTGRDCLGRQSCANLIVGQFRLTQECAALIAVQRGPEPWVHLSQRHLHRSAAGCYRLFQQIHALLALKGIR